MAIQTGPIDDAIEAVEKIPEAKEHDPSKLSPVYHAANILQLSSKQSSSRGSIAPIKIANLDVSEEIEDSLFDLEDRKSNKASKHDNDS